MAQEMNVNEDVKYKLNPEASHEAQVRAYSEHITRLRQREEYRGQEWVKTLQPWSTYVKTQEQAIYARDHISEVDESSWNIISQSRRGVQGL